MFDAEKLQVGDVFYTVKERNQAYARTKIHRVIDGEYWFKYDMPLRTYELVEHKVIGIVRKCVEGNLTFGTQSELESTFLVQSLDDVHVRVREFRFVEIEKCFIDKDEALVYKDKLEAEAKEIDKYD